MFFIIDTVPTGGQVYVVVIPGGFGARLGGQMKKFFTLANARHDPLHKSVNFYPGLKKRIRSCLRRTRRYNCWPSIPILSATMHSKTSWFSRSIYNALSVSTVNFNKYAAWHESAKSKESGVYIRSYIKIELCSTMCLSLTMQWMKQYTSWK